MLPSSKSGNEWPLMCDTLSSHLGQEMVKSIVTGSKWSNKKLKLHNLKYINSIFSLPAFHSVFPGTSHSLQTTEVGHFLLRPFQIIVLSSLRNILSFINIIASIDNHQ